MNVNRTSSFGIKQGLIVILALATAAIHITLLFPDVMFILNGLGYIGLAGAMFLPIPLFQKRRKLIRFAFIGFTAITILLWAVMGERSALGYITKAIELSLITLLVTEQS